MLGYVTEPMAQLYRIVPVSFRDNTLTIAMCDPQNLAIQDELRTFLGYEIRAVVATERDIDSRARPLLFGQRRERRVARGRHGERQGAGQGGRGWSTAKGRST